jgi:murein DD-endopeptidase MepM/ murein hydrolase activator NlpD
MGFKFIVIRITLLFLMFVANIAFSQQSDLELITEKGENGQVKVYGKNNSFAPYTITLYAKLKGFIADKDLPLISTIQGKSTDLLLTISMKPGLEKYSYSFNTSSYMGDVNAKHNDKYTYELPFGIGKSYLVSQGYFGNVSHDKIKALDFTMDEGTMIYAMRDGVVVDVKEYSNVGCPSNECLKEANFITILHDDNSFSEYAHLKKNGASVNVGKKVKRGELIGYSGNTGWATGPHLHIEVYIWNSKDKKMSLDTFFNISGKRTLLKKGDMAKRN